MPCFPVPASLEIALLPAHTEGTSLPLDRTNGKIQSLHNGSDFTDLKPSALQCRRDLPPSPSLLRSTADTELFLYHLP